MSNSYGWPDPRYPHPLSHMPDRLLRRAAETEFGCEIADLEALVWQEVQKQALRGAARKLAHPRRETVSHGASSVVTRPRRRGRRADV